MRTDRTSRLGLNIDWKWLDPWSPSQPLLGRHATLTPPFFGEEGGGGAGW